MTVLGLLAAMAIGARTWQYAYEAWQDGNKGGVAGVAVLGLAVPVMAIYMLFFR